MSAFKIDNVPIKNPSSFNLERYNVTDMQRLADASMAGDLIAKKLKFYFTYDAITAEDLDVILDAIWNTDSIFFELEYEYQGETRYATVYSGSIPTKLHRAGQGANWVWKEVTFNLIER